MSLRKPFPSQHWLGWFGTGVSALVALWAQWLLLPGLALAGAAVDWAVVWVVCWSYQRSWWSAGLGGLIMGLLWDSVTAPLPSHVPGLVLAGLLTVRLRGYRLLRSDPLAVGLLAFAMAVIQETCMALQFVALGNGNVQEIWAHHQKVSLASGLLASLWTPLAWWLLHTWWKKTDTLG